MNETERKIRNILEAYFGADPEEALVAAFRPVSLRGGDWLFREGDVGDSLFFLVRGRLQAWAGEGRPSPICSGTSPRG